MDEQNYAHHSRYVKGYHFVLAGLLIIGVISSLVNIWIQISTKDRVMEAVLITLLFICGLFLFWYARQFPIKAQDRIIRAEENLRYFVLTGNQLDIRLTMSQIVALRFAPNDEFVELADRAANEQLSSKEIKQAIQKWRADHHRI
jgi:hypothetical protein